MCKRSFTRNRPITSCSNKVISGLKLWNLLGTKWSSHVDLSLRSRTLGHTFFLSSYSLVWHTHMWNFINKYCFHIKNTRATKKTFKSPRVGHGWLFNETMSDIYIMDHVELYSWKKISIHCIYLQYFHYVTLYFIL